MTEWIGQHQGSFIALIVIVVVFFLGLSLLKWVLRWYIKVDQGHALILNPWSGDPRVTFTGGLVLPIVNRGEIMDISLKTIEIDRRGNEGLICQDNIRADIKVTFFVRVNKTAEDVLHVAQTVGCLRASKEETLNELFQAKFSEALKTVGKQMDFVELYQEREKFKNRIIETIGQDLSGYKLEDAAIDYLEQTPLDSLSEHNILDAQGIKKIVELTSAERIKANEIRRNQDKIITQQNVDAREKILELERQQADAELRQKKEIEVIRARQEAEAKVIAAEELRRAEEARIASEEAVEVATQNKDRQVQVAVKNRERVVAIEDQRVVKARDLEVIQREREVELQRIEKEKALEVERKNIQDVIRARVAVEKTVAEEEERIKDTRAFFTAERAKKVAILAAEQHAQENLVKDIKQAEAQAIAAKSLAQEQLIMAEAELAKAAKVAEAKMKMAEGIKAETAAEGLARVQVKEADASAIEKVGAAEARALQLKMEANAEGTQKQGVAEAVAIKEKMLAESTGLTGKAEAMKALDGMTRGHEEFRLRLEKEKAVDLASIEARKEIVREQARIMAEAFKNARIDIVGGDGAFFERFVQAVSGGKALDAFVDRSHVVQTLGHDYLEGDASLAKDLKEVLTKGNLGTEDLKNVSIAAVLGKVFTVAQKDEGTRKLLQQLLNRVQDADAKHEKK